MLAVAIIKEFISRKRGYIAKMTISRARGDYIVVREQLSATKWPIHA